MVITFGRAFADPKALSMDRAWRNCVKGFLGCAQGNQRLKKVKPVLIRCLR